MRISPNKFRRRFEASGLSKEDLADAVEREGLEGRKARAAIDHWLNGRQRPEPKGRDIEHLAERLGCSQNDLRMFVSDHRFARVSPRKARLVADMIRGKSVDQAQTALSFSKRRASEMIGKALQAAIENADQAEADVRQLFVSEARVEEGPTMKRFQPKDRGRAFPIMKRTSHIHVAVDER